MQREYGRCVSKQYTEKRDGSSFQSGWVFEKKMRYEDVNKYYTRAVWVTVWSEPPVKVPQHWTGGQYAFAEEVE